MNNTVPNNETLAINGGVPIVRHLPERGLIGPEERAAILNVVDRAIASGTSIEYGGPEEESYCADFSISLGGGYADAVNSGTTALYVALRALGIEPFTEIVVPAVTDPGGMMPVPLLGCIPVVADVAPGSFNCGPAEIEAVLGPLTSAIIVAHIAGEPAPIAAIARLAERHNLPLIEDCAQAHGARSGGEPLGTFGAVSTFSTMWGKHHSTGGQGGVVFTRDRELYHTIRSAADRGKPFEDTPPASRNFLASLNFNQDEISAAIGRVQLTKLHAGVERRRIFVKALTERLIDVHSIQVPHVPPGDAASHWFMRLRYRSTGDWHKERFCTAVIAEGVPLTVTYAALPATYDWYLNQRVFGQRGGFPWSAAEYVGDRHRTFPCPNAHASIADHIVLPIRESWGEREADLIATAFARVDLAARRDHSTAPVS